MPQTYIGAYNFGNLWQRGDFVYSLAIPAYSTLPPVSVMVAGDVRSGLIAVQTSNNTLQFYSNGVWYTTAGGGGSGTVSSITAGEGLTSSPNPIVTVGTITLADSGVTPGTYTNSTVQVDVYGRIITASSGSPSGGTVETVNTSAPLTGGPITTVGTIGITQATASTDGYLSHTDWNIFNNKQAALGGTGIVKSASGVISYISGTSSQFVKGDGSLDSNAYLTSGSVVLTSGTVTSFSAGSLSPLFTTSVATPTTTPSLSFILSNVPAHTYLGNTTSGSTIPAYSALILNSGDFANQGTLNTLLHGNASGTLSWTQVMTNDIATNNVTYSRIQQLSPYTLLGNVTSGTNNVGEITLGSGLAFTGSTLYTTNSGTITAVLGTLNRVLVTSGTTATVDIAPNYIGQSSIGLVGILTSGTWNATPITTPYIANNAVTYAKLQAASTAGILLGTYAIGGTAYQEITIGSSLEITATGTLSLNGLSALSLLGNPTGSSAVPSPITLGGGLSFSGTTLVATGSGGFSNPMTTTGDLIYATSGSTAGRLGIGTTGQVLTVVGSVPTWATSSGGKGTTYTFTNGVTLNSTTANFVSNDLITGKVGGQTIIGGLNSLDVLSYRNSIVDSSGGSTIYNWFRGNGTISLMSLTDTGIITAIGGASFGSSGNATISASGGANFNAAVVANAGIAQCPTFTTSSTATNGNINLVGNGVGSSNQTSVQYEIGSGAGVNTRFTCYGSSATIAIANNDIGNIIFASGQNTTAASGTHVWAWNMGVDKPGITIGTATVTNAASLYIKQTATGATNNYGIYNGGNEYIGSTIVSYNGVKTAGNGIGSIVASNRVTGQTSANSSILTYTLTAADSSFLISLNVNVTTSSAESFTVTCSYTDETNTVRTQTIPFVLLAGTTAGAITFANGAVPYEGITIRIRCKASTTITIATTGTFTGATYNAEADLTWVK